MLVKIICRGERFGKTRKHLTCRYRGLVEDIVVEDLFLLHLARTGDRLVGVGGNFHSSGCEMIYMTMPVLARRQPSSPFTKVESYWA